MEYYEYEAVDTDESGIPYHREVKSQQPRYIRKENDNVVKTLISTKLKKYAISVSAKLVPVETNNYDSYINEPVNVKHINSVIRTDAETYRGQK